MVAAEVTRRTAVHFGQEIRLVTPIGGYHAGREFSNTL